MKYFLSVSLLLLTISAIAQNVGIGTTSPAYKLDVNGRMRIRHIGETAGIWFNGSDNNEAAFVGMLRDTVVGFYGNGNWKVVADVKNGRLGVNNAFPTASLAFDNNTGNKIDFYNIAGTANTANRYGIGLQGGLLQLYSATSGDDIGFGYGASNSFTEAMRIKGNGRVGIGLNNPAAKLDILSTGSLTALNVKGGISTAIYSENSSATVATQFLYNSGGGPAIIAVGNIGINTASPQFPLDVAGGRVRIQHGGSAINSAGIWFDGFTTQQRVFLGMIDNNTIGLYGTLGWNLGYNITNGNLGIGTSTPNAKLQVAGSMSLPYKRVDNANYSVTDDDYSVQLFIPQASGVTRTITLPDASGRAGRIYVLSASIPQGGANNSKVLVYDVNGIDVIAGSNIAQFNTTVHGYFQNCYSRTVYSGLSMNLIFRSKQTSITVQSDGSNWQIINNDFSTMEVNDYYD